MCAESIACGAAILAILPDSMHALKHVATLCERLGRFTELVRPFIRQSYSSSGLACMPCIGFLFLEQDHRVCMP